MVMVPPAEIALAGLKTMETTPKVGKPPTLSAVTKERDVKMLTRPLIEPEATPALTRSLEAPWAEAVGPTVIPVALPAVAPPIVAPASVTVIEVPAAKLASAATVSTRLAAPGVPAVRVVGAAVTAAVPMKPLG